MKVCKSCGKEIVWATTRNGKWVALDPDPVESGGKYRIDEEGTAVCTTVKQREQYDELYVYHGDRCGKKVRANAATFTRDEIALIKAWYRWLATLPVVGETANESLPT